jgi:uncharacterized membrane protein
MKKYRFDSISLIILAVSILGLIAVYGRLPGRIPIHWNLTGEVDRYGRKSEILLFPIISIAMFIWLSVWTPPKTKPNYNIVIIRIMTIFLAAVQYSIVFLALGYNIPVDKAIMIIAGVLYIVLGYYMPMSPNRLYGVRFPWTLNNKEVWLYANRMGKKLMMLMGMALVACGFILEGAINMVILILGTLAIFFTLAISSYLYSKKLH